MPVVWYIDYVLVCDGTIFYNDLSPGCLAIDSKHYYYYYMDSHPWPQLIEPKDITLLLYVQSQVC